MKAKDVVVIGLVGSSLDAGAGSARWERWRPTLTLFQHEELLVRRAELLYQPQLAKLVQTLEADIATVSPETQVRATEITFADPWDFEGVYEALHAFAAGYAFDTDREDYLVHITTGSHVAQICLFLLTESRYLPGRLVQTSPPKRHTDPGPGSYAIIDLDLSKYDRIASRARQEQREGLSFLKAGIDTRNAAFNGLIEQIEKVAISSRA
ncbi:MAG: sigma 54-dependent transcriptional regulator, partial [Deltaproteobacteria bacterium]|nr:sigma 54-dependent transcriptional regulator [Deltaproteobacteria bacterium]